MGRFHQSIRIVSLMAEVGAWNNVNSTLLKITAESQLDKMNLKSHHIQLLNKLVDASRHWSSGWIGVVSFKKCSVLLQKFKKLIFFYVCFLVTWRCWNHGDEICCGRIHVHTYTTPPELHLLIPSKSWEIYVHFPGSATVVQSSPCIVTRPCWNHQTKSAVALR